LLLGHDRQSSAAVALKVWHLVSETDRRAFEAEATLVDSIEPHQNLPTFVDSFVEVDRGVLVTEWVEGVSLEQVLTDRGSPGLAPSLVVAYLEQAARALDHLSGHDPPLVHGDVKPENMILTPDGSVVLVDFGSADPLAMEGTVGFLAPELAAGHPKTGSSDIYALAVTAFKLITGTMPKEGPVLDGVEATTARAVTSGLRAALTVEPRTRPATATALVERLRAAFEAADLLAPTPDRAREVSARRFAVGSDAAIPIPLPHVFDDRGRTAFVGRRDILGFLDQVRTTVRDGCQIALLAGEPGAGKTRIAAETARSAWADGSIVLYGRCEPEREIPYQPFAEALAWQVAHDGGQALGPLAGELTRILPDLDRFVADLPAPLATDPQLEEHRTFDAVAEWLIRTSQHQGLAFVVDDLHWATKATLALLEHVLRRAKAAGSQAPILFLGTYRDTDLDDGSPLLEVLPELSRATDVCQVAVGGLVLDEISELVEGMSGHELDDVAHQIVRSLTDDSGGNPFFAIEILRNMLETGALRIVDSQWQLEGDLRPTSDVEGALELRFRRLPEPARASLSTASVIGMNFDLELLSTLVGLARRQTLELLDAVLGLGLLDETEPERFRFEHALVRSALYEAIEPSERQRIHKEVLRTLESLGRTHSATLATHAMGAAPTGPDLARALEYALAAGEEAFRVRAFGDAESWSDRVLAAAGSERSLRALRIRALCLAGDAERDQGNPAFRETLLRAGHEALGAGLGALAVRSAIANYRGTVSIIGKIDEPRVDLMRKAMALESGSDRRQWALLAATLASDLTYDPNTPLSVRLDLVARARAIARSTEDDGLLREVLLRTMGASSVPGSPRERVETGCELVALADATGDPSARVLARWATTTTHMPAGELALFKRYLDEAEEASRQNCPARVRWLAGLGRPQFLAGSGDLPGARAANDEMLALGELAGEPDALMFWSAVTFGLSLLEGTVGDFADLAGSNADQFPEFPVWRIAHALALGAAGRLAEGRNVLDRHRLREVHRIPVDVLTLACWSLLSIAAFHLKDVELARALEPTLRSHLDAWSHTSVWILGPTPWDLGRCQIVQQNWESAVLTLDGAVAQCEESGLETHAAVCRLDLVRALLGRGGLGDRNRAAVERDRGLAATKRFGLDRRTEQFQALGV
jgi:Protein kinase domain/AAA ATPase domain